MKKEREFLGEGVEHKVYRALAHDVVLKIPKSKFDYLKLFTNAPKNVLREIKEAEKRVEGTDIQLPETRVFKFGRSYIISQKTIEEDYSIPNLAEEMEKYKNSNRFLYTTYLSNPRNFASRNGNIYWIDQVNGIVTFLEEKTFGLINIERYRKTRILYRAVVKNAMNFLKRF